MDFCLASPLEYAYTLGTTGLQLVRYNTYLRNAYIRSRENGTDVKKVRVNVHVRLV